MYRARRLTQAEPTGADAPATGAKGKPMANTHGLARLGMLVVGLGIGAAMAPSPAASADSSSDWLSSIDSLLTGAVPAPATSGLDLAISYDGYTLFSEGGAIANTFNGDYSLAIAEGPTAEAYAYGTGGSAFADGSDAYAYSGGGTGDHADADGTNAFAIAGGNSLDTGANYDSAIDIGNNDEPYLGGDDGALAGNADLVDDPSGGTGSDDTAIDIGNNTNDASLRGDDGAFSGAVRGASGENNNDTAVDVGNNSGTEDGSFAGYGSGNYASESGSNTGEVEGAYATVGNDNTAIADTNYTTDLDTVSAYQGNDNYAAVVGPENSVASAGAGDSNIAYIVDPFGSTASEATSGIAGANSDLAAVLFTDGTATATGTNFLYDILTAFGLESGTF
jgi:hypothetical protein